MNPAMDKNTSTAATSADASPGAPSPTNRRPTEVNATELWRFYAPLGASMAMMTVTHAIINGSLNRTSHPELSIAAYAVSNSVTTLSESQMVMLRQTGAALLRDRAGWAPYVRVAVAACAMNLLLSLAIAWTPLAHFVFQRLLGVRDAMFPSVLSVYRVAMFIMVFSMLRSLFHAVLLVRQKTLWITLGMALRLAVMAGLAVAFTLTGTLDTGTRGAVIFLAGMATEAISGFGSFRKWFHTLPASAESSYVLTTQRAAMFYLPLVVASLTGAFAYSIINAGLARMADPRSVIATFAIANVVTYLLLGPLFMLHQVSLFFGAMPGVPGSRERNALVKRFCLWIGFIATAILGLLAWTPLGDWLLLRAFQSPSALLPLVKQVLRVSMFVPLVVAWNEYRTGRLLAAGRSRTMTAAKFCNLAMLAATMLAVTKLAPRMGAVAAPIAVLCALTAEQLVLLRATARMRKEGTDGN